MGLFDLVGDAVDTVREGVQTGARKVATATSEFLERLGGFGQMSTGISMLDKAALAVTTLGYKVAGSVILMAAQTAIRGMRATTGSGDPIDGEEFKNSAEKLHEATEILLQTNPVQELWDGTASDAYGAKSSAQRHYTIEVRDADKTMRAILSNEAHQVAKTRQSLTDRMDFLADFDTATSWMASVPGGLVPKLKLDLLVASATVLSAKGTLGKLVWDSLENASEIRDLVAKYEYVDKHDVLKFGDCTPFGDEHIDGTRPTRTQSDEYIPPPFHGPAVEYPPAFPLPHEPSTGVPATP